MMWTKGTNIGIKIGTAHKMPYLIKPRNSIETTAKKNDIAATKRNMAITNLFILLVILSGTFLGAVYKFLIKTIVK